MSQVLSVNFILSYFAVFCLNIHINPIIMDSDSDLSSNDNYIFLPREKQIKINPQKYLEYLERDYSSVVINPYFDIKKYYEVGDGILQAIDFFEQTCQYENAYILCLKYNYIFEKRIKQHPQIKRMNPEKVSSIQLKSKRMQTKITELKLKLLARKCQQADQYKRECEEDLSTDVSYSMYLSPSEMTISGLALAGKDMEGTGPSVAKERKLTTMVQGFTLRLASSRTLAMRGVVLPGAATVIFQAKAYKNTVQRNETVGFLLGSDEQHDLIITHLLIPKQKGLPDHFHLINYEEVNEYRNGFVVIGWIHTHPEETPYLSSVDMHFQCAIQTFLPEAIAVVCSAKYMQTGIFNLTQRHGLPLIRNCNKKGFHTHSTENVLWNKAFHVRVDKGAPIEVIDLRN